MANKEDVATHIASEGPHCRLRPEIVLKLLGDDLLVDIQVGDPIFIHIRRRHGVSGIQNGGNWWEQVRFFPDHQ
jgi:hypothetical protein